MLRISNLRIWVKKVADKDSEKEILKKEILRKLKIDSTALLSFKLAKKSIDARNKSKVYYVYMVDVKIRNCPEVLAKIKDSTIKKIPLQKIKPFVLGKQKLAQRPIIIGTGPAGLISGLLLAQNGYQPLLLERGEDVNNRVKTINKFWNNGVLNTDSNVQFGEGGAGTFSDGKLTTLINDIRCQKILEIFVDAGADDEILYQNKPHIGTDRLRKVVKEISRKIIAAGGEVRFNQKVTDFIIKDSKIIKLIVNGQEEIPCENVLLAGGHSARDTIEKLFLRGVNIIPKAFSIGLRIEHLQMKINKSKYGADAKYLKDEAADYKLVYHDKNGRSVYTFCMCPGGVVIGAASEKEGVVTNGMSYYHRKGQNANSALLVGVTTQDFFSDHPLAGIDFQRHWEKQAFLAGGENYNAPAQLLKDFIAGQPSKKWGSVIPTYQPGVEFAQLEKCLPDYVLKTIIKGLKAFDRKIKGFADGDAILTGCETRSSSAVRILRAADYQSNIRGLYPVGEGAGYAGGIVSAAVDGYRVAEKIMEQYAPELD